MSARRLPIDACLPRLLESLARHPRVLLQAPPGAGKTTRVPPALLRAPWVGQGRVLVLEPRRLAARAAAYHMAAELGEAVGGQIGYRVRFDSRVSERTRVEVITEGILIRRLQHDPELAGVATVIFDEFHERSLQADLALALCREAQQALRPDLRLLVMSATLDSAGLATRLDAPVVAASGRVFPVQLQYRHAGPLSSLPARMARALAELLRCDGGDLLAFLPGAAEISRTHAMLEADPRFAAMAVHRLHGDMSLHDQQCAIGPDPNGRRKVILSTPVAETSLTVEGVDTVIDGGYRRAPRFDPNTGLTRLVTERISRDSAEQRAGRAGRLGPGRCVRLWTEAEQAALAPRRQPEILDADLAGLALELAVWGAADATALPWLDPPPPGNLAQARDLLTLLEALDGQGRITTHGRAMAELPVHPRLARMLGVAAGRGQAHTASLLAALLEDRATSRPGTGANLDMHLQQLRQPSGRRGTGSVQRTAAQIRRLLGVDHEGDAVEAGGLLLHAYPDRVAQRRQDGRTRYRLTGGRGATLGEDDPLAGCDWLVAPSVDSGKVEGRIHLAAAVDRSAIAVELAGLISTEEIVAWDRATDAVTARRNVRLGALVMESRALGDLDASGIVRAMLEGVHAMGLDALPWTPALRQWQARVLTLRHALPEGGWPDVSDTALLWTLESWLAPFLVGCARRAHLQRVDLRAALGALLPFALANRLDQDAPTHLAVPSGSRIALQYQPDGSPPVLAVKLQEMFGLADSPRIAQGRVPVLLHLLSPARRPIQVTRDLRGFWDRTYPEVRRELKGRYPKHPWPQDPWNAAPTARVRSRG